jgi:uncharacterized membrane protein
MNGFKLKTFALLAALAVVAVLVGERNVERGCARMRVSGESLMVPLVHLAPGSAKVFCYQDRTGEKLRFVLARQTDGTVQAVFDACRQCYKFHEGFDAGHGYVTCRYCGNRYKISELAVGKASCVPVKLRAKVERSNVRVDVADLEAGRWLF